MGLWLATLAFCATEGRDIQYHTVLETHGYIDRSRGDNQDSDSGGDDDEERHNSMGSLYSIGLNVHLSLGQYSECLEMSKKCIEYDMPYVPNECNWEDNTLEAYFRLKLFAPV